LEAWTMGEEEDFIAIFPKIVQTEEIKKKQAPSG
jgi:hypothetical protein